MDWTYLQPVEIIFKTGGIDELDAICASRAYHAGVLVCDPFFVKSGLAQKTLEAAGGRLKAMFSEVTPNPRTAEANACAELLRSSGADFAVALGGGSAIDCAKIACALATCPEKAEAYHTGGQTLPGTALPLIAIPTTAGTGSEVTGVSVLTDPDKGVKAP
ncbi:MAG: iron-containing alcohol dehydrogenase, partial [Bacillota bacterium]